MKKNDISQNDQGKAAIKFGLWMIFIVVLIIVGVFNNKDIKLNEQNPEESKEEEKEVFEFKNYDTMQAELLNGNYNYTYRLNIKEENYIFSGTKCNNRITGYKESKDGVTKYVIEGDKTYKNVLGNLEETNELYEGIDSSFLNLNTLFDNLKEYLYNVDKNDNKRTITYNKEGYGVIVKTDLENITSIEIKLENDTYNLEFTKNEKCDSINLTEN